MRTITDHIVEGDSANHQLQIYVTDEPGQGGANHRYEITGFDTGTNPSAAGDASPFSGEIVLFQNGPIKEFGVNGVTNEVLLAIVIDRLKLFQGGPYACDDNYLALVSCQAAMLHLQARTRAWIARGVEGTHER
jgi:hypothetical protein